MASTRSNSVSDFFMVDDKLVKSAIEIASHKFIETKPSSPNFNDIHPVAGTQIYATPGPNKSNMAAFFRKILAEPVAATHIIALGDCLSPNDMLRHDYHNYVLAVPQTESEVQFYKDDLSNYKVETKNNKVNPEDYDVYVISKQIGLKKMMHTTLTVSEVDNSTAELSNSKKLKVTLLPVGDNCGIQQTRETIEEILQLYKRTYLVPENKTIIHCKAGKGRTGHLLFTFRLMHFYQEIFGQRTAEMVATKILDHLAELRKTDKDFVRLNEQFVSAIQLAHATYKYALERKMKNVPGKSIFSPVQPSEDELLVHQLTSLNILLTRHDGTTSNTNGIEIRSNSL